jgi:hypothetical protein
MRACFSIKPGLMACLLLVAPTAWPAIAATSAEQAAGATTLTTWPVQKPTIILGNPLGHLWEQLEVPLNIVKGLSNLLQGDPKTWTFSRNTVFGHGDFDLVSLFDSQGDKVVLLVEDDKWTQLNNPQGLSYINRRLNPKVSWEASKNPRDFEGYIEYVVQLYSGKAQILLRSGFFKANLNWGPVDGWLRGTEKNPEVLYSVCIDPVFIPHGDTVEIHANAMTREGAIEQWTLSANADDKPLKILSLSTKELYPPGTFSYAFAF